VPDPTWPGTPEPEPESWAAPTPWAAGPPTQGVGVAGTPAAYEPRTAAWTAPPGFGDEPPPVRSRGWRPGPIGIAIIVAAVLAAFGLGAALVSPIFAGRSGSTAAPALIAPSDAGRQPPLVNDGPSDEPTATPTPTDTPSPTRTTAPASDEAALVAVENSVVDLVNRERRRAHCDPVRNDPALHAAARAHSADMGAAGKVDHDGSDGSTPSDRMRAAGYPRPASENLAAGFRSPDQVMRAWMRSRSHRQNIVDCDAAAVGVGVAVGRDGKAYWTQDFGK